MTRMTASNRSRWAPASAPEHTWWTRPGLAPLDHADANEWPLAASEDRHQAAADVGHDFGQVPVRSSTEDTHTCPLALATPRACPFGGACHSCPTRVQTTLTISEPGDEYEQEADRVAERVMRMPDPLKGEDAPESNEQSTQTVQRKCAQCESKEELLRRNESAAQDARSEGSPAVQSVIHEALGSPGQPLDFTTRDDMEPRFARSFSNVRVHTDQVAAVSANALHAAAYTVGSRIVFGAGMFAPASPAGRKLLAHELVHVVQQERQLEQQRPSIDAGTGLGRRTGKTCRDLQPRARPSVGPMHIQREVAGGTAAEACSEPEPEAPEIGTTSILWFLLNSDRLREDREAQSSVHLAIALRRIREHGQAAGEEQRVVLHGYASREGAEAHNVALSQRRASRVLQLLVLGGVRAERISTVAHGPDSSLPGLAWNRRVEITLQPAVTMIEMEPERVTAAPCRCLPSSAVNYDAATLRFISSIAPLVNAVAARRGVPAHAVAGAIADEYDTQRGARGVLDSLQNAVINAIPEWAIDVDRFFDFHSKLLNTLENDIGPANIKVRTALELVQRNELTVPGSPPSDIQVNQIVDYLLTEEGTVEASAAVIARAQTLFGPHTSDYGEGFSEAVLVEYFKQGDRYYERFRAALVTDPRHRPCPGDDGCQFLHNHERIAAALGTPPP